ncbi:MAG: hypothetical protein LBD22_00250 [Spirochaetaceae bacterium]|jgi:hypothetical protein|nr:hypothetical protein [Spirochaetaceae bacterium]
MGDIIHIALKLALGGLASVFAIAVWARTRDASWLFVVLGILAFYTETIYFILERLGFTSDLFIVNQIMVLPIVFSSLPPLFFITAFLIILIKKRRL